MYTVRLNYDKNFIHDPSIGLFIVNPHLVLEENCAGSFEFDMPPDHPQIDAVKRLKCEISVFRDGDEIWAGRPVEEHTDFYGVKHVYCEGLLSALFDTTQPPSERHDTSVFDFLDAMLKIHNSQITPTYKWRPFFRAGTVTVKDNLYRYTNYEETLTCINEKLVKRLGGHLRIRRKDGTDAFNFLLDYLKDYPTQSTQVIRFGQNLLDYSKNFDASGLATVIVPLGARQEEKDIEALEKYLDVASVNDGSIYVQDDALVELYGKIVKVVHWDDVTTAKELLKKAKLYLTEMQYDNMQLEVKAVDFHLADENVPAINLLDKIRVVSAPHGLDKFFPVTKLDIQLDQPENTIITLGTVVKTSLTSQTNDRTNELKALIDAYVPPSEILTQAKNQATQLIESGALGGHVVVLPNEIYISDSDDISAAEKQWRWNLNGLGYRSSKQGDFGLAMTMDGSIVADYITTGLMSADRIRGGSLKLGGGSYKNGILYMYDANSVEIGRWSSGGLNVKKGTITGSTITVGGQGNVSGRLRIVDENNILIGWWDKDGLNVKKGSITGTTITGTTITVGGKNNESGRLRIVDSAKKLIGWWDNSGLNVKSGSISGASVQVGGKNNADGVLTVHDEKGAEIGKWDRNGLTVIKGDIRGASVVIGGQNNVDGLIKVLNADGSSIGQWDKDGLNIKKGTIKGTTITGGTISGTTISGTTIKGGTISGTTISGGVVSGASIRVGGDDGENGVLKVYNAEGSIIGQWDKDGLNVKEGIIKGTNISGATISASTFEVKGTSKISLCNSNGTEVGQINKSGIYYGTHPNTGFDSITTFEGTLIDATEGLILTGNRKIEIYEDELEAGTTEIKIGNGYIDFLLNNSYAYGDKQYERHGRIKINPLQYYGFPGDSVADFIIEGESRLVLQASKVCFKSTNVSILSGSTEYDGYSGTMTLNSRRLRFMKGLLVEVTTT